jgi:predicted lipid-binding transport protein (Tim44 family)
MDILFFAAVALFIFFKLSKNLGKIDEEEKKQIEEKLAKKRVEILAIQQQFIKQYQERQAGQSLDVNNQADEKIIIQLAEPTKENFIKILSACNISATFFVNGAKSAFEMVIKAFAAIDLETLKFMLSDKIYQGFENAINQRKSQEHTLTTNLITVEKAEIISATILGDNASIMVKFVSKQINYISDKQGQIIEGRKDEINEITDTWTFRKDLNVADPNWVVCATSNS